MREYNGLRKKVISRIAMNHLLKTHANIEGLPGWVAQLVGASSHTPRLVSGQDTWLGGGFDSGLGHTGKATNQCFSLTSMFLSLFSFLTLKSVNIFSREDLKKSPGLKENYEVQKNGLQRSLGQPFVFYLQTLKGIVGCAQVRQGRKRDGIQVPSHMTRVHLAQRPFIEFHNFSSVFLHITTN